MKKDIEHINLAFNTAAQQCFFSVCDRFEKSTEAFDRWECETEYIQLHAMYLELMRELLDKEAMGLIEKHKDLYDFAHLRMAFTVHINRYLNEFRVKYRLA